MTYPCHGGLGMECVSISSNDMLQLGVVLLSYREVLQDSTGKKGSHTSQTENNKFSNATCKNIPQYQGIDV